MSAPDAARLEQEYCPSRETLEGVRILYLHADEFLPEFHSWARECLGDPERRAYHLHKYKTNWPQWREDPFYDQTMKLLGLTKGGKCQPPKGEPPCDAKYNFVGHHVRYDHWGAEVAYLEDLRHVCSVHHRMYHEGQKRYALLCLAREHNYSPELKNQMAAELDRLGEVYEIRAFGDLPYRIQKWVEDCGLRPNSSEDWSVEF
jgi:hypothetical protein